MTPWWDRKLAPSFWISTPKASQPAKTRYHRRQHRHCCRFSCSSNPIPVCVCQWKNYLNYVASLAREEKSCKPNLGKVYEGRKENTNFIARAIGSLCVCTFNLQHSNFCCTCLIYSLCHGNQCLQVAKGEHWDYAHISCPHSGKTIMAPKVNPSCEPRGTISPPMKVLRWRWK